LSILLGYITYCSHNPKTPVRTFVTEIIGKCKF